MKSISIFSIALLILLFSGCAKNSNTQSKIISEPKWLVNPNLVLKDKIGAVGCATRHYNGEPAQRKLALQRAIDEIAMQVSSKVQTSTFREKKVEGSYNASSKSSTKSLQTVNNLNVKTKVLDWYKKPDGDICVLVSKE